MQLILEWLVAQWTSRFSEIMLTMGDLQPRMHVGSTDEAALEGELLWWQQAFTCTPSSPLWIGVPEETWSEVGKLILTAAGVDSAPVSEVQSTYIEIIRQSMSGLAQDIGDRISSQVSATTGRQSEPEKVARHSFRIEAELPGKSIQFYLVISDDLCRSLSDEVSDSGGVPALRAANNQVGDAASPAASGSPTFNLLLDVELPLSVSFGRTSLKLQDAMKLITGSLIELDRSISDPVELLVNNCVIARGEVVVVDGNYGVRITEIISQQERLQQSRRYMLQ